MRRFIRFIEERRLQTRLLLFILLAVFIILILYGQYSMWLNRRSLEQRLHKQWQLQVDGASSILSSIIYQNASINLEVYGNEAIREALEETILGAPILTSSERHENYTKAAEIIYSLQNVYAHNYIAVFPLTDQFFLDYTITFPEALYTYPNDLSPEMFFDSGFRKSFYQYIRGPQYTRRPEDRREAELTLTRVIYHKRDKPLAIVCTQIDNYYLRSTVKQLFESDGYEAISLTLDDGTEVLHLENGANHEEGVLVSSHVDPIGAKLSVVFPNSLIEQNENKELAALQLALLLSLFLSALAIISSTGYLMRGYNSLVMKYATLNKDSGLAIQCMPGNDEVAQLDQEIARLYLAYRKQFEELFQLQIKLKDLENHLQLSKMNPHFLYNTLSAVRWSMDEEGVAIIDKLVSLYRGMLAQGKPYTILERDVLLLEQYIDLHVYTYSREIQFVVDVPEELNRCVIPTFLLQPVIENAIQHSGRKPIEITLSANKHEGALKITITNNGRAISDDALRQLNSYNDMSPESLSKLLVSNRDLKSYGIFNVIFRIRLLFGDKYGLRHSRPDNQGTVAEFTLPLGRTMDEIKQIIE